MNPGRKVVEGALWLVAAASVFWATLWVLGVNGFARLAYDDLPRVLQPVGLYGAKEGGWVAAPAVPVDLHGADRSRAWNLYVQLNGMDGPNGGLTTSHHFAEILPGSVVQFQGTDGVQRWSYVLVQVAIFLAVASIAVTLARMVASSRTDSPFTTRNARRLSGIGLLLVAGAPAASLARWACLRWMADTSSLADRVTFPSYRFASLPFWSICAGAAFLVLAGVWKRGVEMTEDVRGLV